MDANEFYTRKEDILERLSNALSEVREALSLLSEAREALSLLKALEHKADETGRIYMEELECIIESINDASEWANIELTTIHPMVEAARQASKK